jgi:4-hydroxy-3-polyprenylbenzoate decarboxylase
MSTQLLPIALGVTGASGSPYVARLLEVLLEAERTVHLVMSPNADEVARLELGRPLSDLVESMQVQHRNLLHTFARNDFMSPMASGSARYAGMAICPCSMGTLGRIASGGSDDLLSRAADVMLKERRRLVLVPREMPYNAIHLENMLKLTRAGAVVVAASPGFYHQPQSIDDLVDFVVQRVCDLLGVYVSISQRWGD